MLKTGGVCQLSDMQDHHDVHEIHEHFEKQARKRNPIVREADIKKVYTLKKRMRKSKRKISELHPDLAHLCKDLPILETSDVIVDKETWEKHSNGEVVFLNEKSSRDTRDSEQCILVFQYLFKTYLIGFYIRTLQPLIRVLMLVELIQMFLKTRIQMHLSTPSVLIK